VRGRGEGGRGHYKFSQKLIELKMIGNKYNGAQVNVMLMHEQDGNTFLHSLEHN